jgi:DNA-binding transcriptional ArsR family regulator
MLHEFKGKKFHFIFSKPLELLYAVTMVAYIDKLTKDMDKKHKKIFKDTISTVDKMQTKLTSYMNWEMQYFFHKYSCIYSTTMGVTIYMKYLLHNHEIKSIEEMLQAIDDSDEKVMLSYMIEDLYYENYNRNIRDVYNLDKIINNPLELIEIIGNLDLLDIDVKQKLIESIENPQETKKRYVMFLRQFYEKAYLPFEDDIDKSVEPALKLYYQEFRSNPEKFSRKYFLKDINVFGQEILIHVSYFKCLGSDYWATKKGTECLIFGSESWKFISEEPEREKILAFLKAIADKRRMNIIELLAEKSWYVNEIAEEIGMSAATTSYHLTNLHELGIVDFDRVEHRFYYYLNKARLRELFHEAMKIYLHE